MPDALSWGMRDWFEVIQLEPDMPRARPFDTGVPYLHVHPDRIGTGRPLADHEIDERTLAFYVRPGEIIVRRWRAGLGRLTIAVQRNAVTLLCCGTIPDTVIAAAPGRRMHELFNDPFFAAGTGPGELEIVGIELEEMWDAAGDCTAYLAPSYLVETKPPALTVADIPHQIRTLAWTRRMRR